MENQDKKTDNSNPKPSDDAQSLVETIIPSTEDKASTTTKVEHPEIKELENNNTEDENEKLGEVKADIKDSAQREEANEDDQKKNDEGDKIETIAP